MTKHECHHMYVAFLKTYCRHNLCMVHGTLYIMRIKIMIIFIFNF